jgi:hypothetical protein
MYWSILLPLTLGLFVVLKLFAVDGGLLKLAVIVSD